MREKNVEEITLVLAPQIDVNDEKLELISWDVSHGETIEKGTVLCSVESTKTTQDVIAEQSGVIYLRAKEDQIIKVGEVIAYIGSTMIAIEDYLIRMEKEEKEKSTGKDLHCTERAKSLAEQYQIHIEDVPRKGSIVKEKDVISYIELLNKQKITQVTIDSPRKVELPDSLLSHVECIGELSLHKKHVAQHLSITQRNIIFTTSEVEICIEEANHYLERIKKENRFINLFHLIIINTAKLLEEFILLKSFYFEGNLYQYKDTHISFIVVDTEKDYHLFTPVIKYASKLALEQTASTCNELTLNVYRNEITSEEMTGGCFTLTMLTGLEVRRFTALQNQYQSAILAVGNPYERLVMKKNGTIYSKQFINLTLSYDHRICDGFYTGQFLTELKYNIEQVNE